MRQSEVQIIFVAKERMRFSPLNLNLDLNLDLDLDLDLDGAVIGSRRLPFQGSGFM
jgi:hypothetical protein